jgi:hypothetical protein
MVVIIALVAFRTRLLFGLKVLLELLWTNLLLAVCTEEFHKVNLATPSLPTARTHNDCHHFPILLL